LCLSRAKRRSERVLCESPLDPELVLSLEGLGDRGATYEEYADVWATIDTINGPEARDLLEAADIDIAFVISWPELLDVSVLEIPELGCIGRHISLLPKRRGRAPVAWALIQNLDETGVTLFWLDEGVDTGDIALQRSVPIDADDEAHDLYEKATDATIDLVSELHGLVADGDVPREP
jgi:methionyl-tRNA formyltransferase